MALVETLTDDFGFLDTTTKWSASGTVTVSAGRLNLTCASTAGDVTSQSNYSLTGSSVWVALLQVPRQGVAEQNETILKFQAAVVQQYCYVYNSLLFFSEWTGSATDEISISYDPVAHKYLRLRESGGTIFWDTSPDSIVWTNRRSKTASGDYSSGSVRLQSHMWGTGTSGDIAIFDDLNTLGYSYQPRPFLIPNRYVGPMALRDAFRRAQPWIAESIINLSGGTSDTAITVGLTADGVVGTVSSATTAVTVGLTADGVVGTVSSATTAVTVGLTAAGVVETVSSATTAVTVGLTAGGFIDELHLTPPLRIPNRSVGPMALRAAYRFATPQVSSVPLGDFTGTAESTDLTVELTAVGVVGTVGSATTAVTVGLIAGGSVDAGIAAPPLRIPNRYVGPMTLRQLFRRAQPWLNANSGSITITPAAAVFTLRGAGFPYTLPFTFGAGFAPTIEIRGNQPAPPLRIPNRYVGPMTLRQLFRRAQLWLNANSGSITITPAAAVFTLRGAGFPYTLPFTFGAGFAPTIEISGTPVPAAPLQIPNRYVGPMALRNAFRRAQQWIIGSDSFSGTADTAITVGLTAAGVVGTVGSATTETTVGFTADGGVGIVGSAATAITVGLTSAGVVGTVSSATTIITAGLTADGIVGLVGSADLAIAVGLTADGTNPANIPPVAVQPFTIPNRYVGPMALRDAFRRAQPWIAESIINLSGGTSDTAITVGLTADGVVGTVSSATAAVTVGLTAAGVVGTVSNATTAIAVGLTADGVVGKVSTASTVITVGLTASGVVGTVGTAITTVTAGLTATGVVGKVSTATTDVIVGLTTAGVVGVRSSATTAITIDLTADGFITSDDLVGTAATLITIGLTAAGVLGLFTSPKHTVMAQALTRTTTANATTHVTDADATTRETTAG